MPDWTLITKAHWNTLVTMLFTSVRANNTASEAFARCWCLNSYEEHQAGEGEGIEREHS